MGGDVGPVTIN